MLCDYIVSHFLLTFVCAFKLHLEVLCFQISRISDLQHKFLTLQTCQIEYLEPQCTEKNSSVHIRMQTMHFHVH